MKNINLIKKNNKKMIFLHKNKLEEINIKNKESYKFKNKLIK